MKQLIRKHFPYPTYNPGQEEAIEQILRAFENGAEHVVADIPTGVGKSAIAWTVHKVMQEIDSSHRTTITTGTKGLQDQYTAEFKDITDLRGKKNYKCLKKLGEFYGSSYCKQQIGMKTCSKDVCPYVIQRDNWRFDADIRITNISFQIQAPPSLIADSDTIPSLVILDECHELPNNLVEHNTVKLFVEDFKVSRDRLGDKFIGLINDFISEFTNINIGNAFIPTKDQLQVAKSVADLMEGARDNLKNKNKKEDQAVVEELDQVLEKLRLFCSTANGEWILTQYSFGSQIELKPVYAHLVAESGIFRKAPRFLHMSATVCGGIEYADSLGLPDETHFIHIDSPIPVENRLVHAYCTIPVNRQVDIRNLTKQIDVIIDAHRGENGVIHTVSFDLAQKIIEASKHKKKMLVSRDRAEIMSWLKRKDVILLSASVETGYDFKGELARYQIIAKVPYGYIGDPYVKLNMNRDPNWYSREAIMRIVQASGRAVRGITDYADTYIIDSNFKRLLSQNQHMFPEWYLKAIR